VKRILFITHLHPDLVRGGAQQSCYELFDEFRNDPEYDPVLLACAPKWACGKLFVHRNAVIGYDRRDEYLYLTQKYDTFWHSSTEMKVLRDFARFLESFKPDIIHFQHYLFAGLEAVEIARKTLPRAKIVMTMHEFTPICHSDGQMVKNQTRDLCVKDSPFACHECFPAFSPSAFARRRKYILEVFDLIDHFVMPSHFLVERYRAWGLPSEKISFIDYGRTYANDAVAPKDVPRQKRISYNRFGFTGQLIVNKGGTVVLDAVEILRRRGIEDFHVYVYGANLANSPEYFRKRFEDMDDTLHQNVTMKGSYHSSQLAQVMQTLDWVIVPSIWWENSPLVIQEAFMHGKPVICSDIGGMAEKVRHMVDGLHFAVRDPHSLADMMQLAIEDASLQPRLVDNIEPILSAREGVEQHKKLYASIGVR
jgi:glycosyltransferase involved in cell wall biosynthesis